MDKGLPRLRILRMPKFSGLVMAGLTGTVALMLGSVPGIADLGLGPLALAIFVGMALGNLATPRIRASLDAGLATARGPLLRFSIAVFGLRITVQELSSVGVLGLATDFLVVFGIFFLAWFVGVKVLRLDRDQVWLVGAGSAICGAAAVLAVDGVLKTDPKKSAVAVGTVVLFGSFSLVLYPLIFAFADPGAYALAAGSTVHEVAQVAAAAQSRGEEAAALAVATKMFRVALLAPFLATLGLLLRRDQRRAGSRLATEGKAGARGADSPASRVDPDFAKPTKRPPLVPVFALGFLLASVARTALPLPQAGFDFVVKIDYLLLTVAMAAVGLGTHFAVLREAGWKPLALGAILWLALLGIAFSLALLG